MGKKRQYVAEVESIEPIAARMVRIELGLPRGTARDPERGRACEAGSEDDPGTMSDESTSAFAPLTEMRVPSYADRYLKLVIPPPGAPYEVPFDPKAMKRDQTDEFRPRRRAFTIRRWQPEVPRLTLDIFTGRTGGLAESWLARLCAGDLVQMQKPSGDWSPDSHVDHLLLIGDECVIPSIANALDQVRADTRVTALIEVDSAGDEVEFETDADLDLHWLHRDEGDAAPAAVLDLDLHAPSHAEAFVHGEAGMVREVRRILIKEMGLEPRAISASGYWKRARTDEAWREEKSEWKRLVAADSRG